MTPDEARARLVAALAGSGALDEGWRVAFERVPRHLFIPDMVWRLNGSGRRLVALHRGQDPGRWLELAYSDAPVDTQVDDGYPDADGGVEVTSSTSRPSMVARMLGALAPEPGMRVVERSAPERAGTPLCWPIGWARAMWCRSRWTRAWRGGRVPCLRKPASARSA